MAEMLNDPSDPWRREGQTYPVLPEEMIDRVRKYGETHVTAEDAFAFARGDHGLDFFLVTAGEMEVYADHPLHGKQYLYSYKVASSAANTTCSTTALRSYRECWLKERASFEFRMKDSVSSSPESRISGRRSSGLSSSGALALCVTSKVGGPNRPPRSFGPA